MLVNYLDTVRVRSTSHCTRAYPYLLTMRSRPVEMGATSIVALVQGAIYIDLVMMTQRSGSSLMPRVLNLSLGAL